MHITPFHEVGYALAHMRRTAVPLTTDLLDLFQLNLDAKSAVKDVRDTGATLYALLFDYYDTFQGYEDSCATSNAIRAHNGALYRAIAAKDSGLLTPAEIAEITNTCGVLKTQLGSELRAFAECLSARDRPWDPQISYRSARAAQFLWTWDSLHPTQCA